MAAPVLTLSVSEFKAKCLAVFRDLEAHRHSRVVVTRRGKPIAEMIPPKQEVPDIYGCMKGRAIIPPDLDLTAPILQDIPEAETGERGP